VYGRKSADSPHPQGILGVVMQFRNKGNIDYNIITKATGD
jgi:hypothetical protein